MHKKSHKYQKLLSFDSVKRWNFDWNIGITTNTRKVWERVSNSTTNRPFVAIQIDELFIKQITIKFGHINLNSLHIFGLYNLKKSQKQMTQSSENNFAVGGSECILYWKWTFCISSKYPILLFFYVSNAYRTVLFWIYSPKKLIL